MNAKHLATLELPKILERLAKECSFSASQLLAAQLSPADNAADVRALLEQTAQARAALEAIDTLSIGAAHDIRDPVRRAARGGMLEPSEMLEIMDTLRSVRTIQRVIAKHADEYPRLYEITYLLDSQVELADDIARTIDDRGEVRDSASPALGRIRAEVRVAHDRLMTRLQRMVGGEAAQYLQEALVTQRGGRYVIPIKADFKGRIPGVVHDQSSSGQTLFIEPLAVLELNNAWRELQMEEQNEIRRILTALSGRIGSQRDVLLRNVEQLALFDLALAKAKYADRIRAVMPLVMHRHDRDVTEGRPQTGEGNAASLSVLQARHPLLDPEKVVPIDVTLDERVHVLVITGPNTGGKTVAMKTIGLFVAMAQCGLHVPATSARLPVVKAIYADIGDEQSIEQSLSTFSAHLSNLTSFLSHVDEGALVILDELGSGTDPIEGAALARSILEYLLRQNALCIVATHYAELKSWAALTEGVANANVAFDVKTLRPLYKLSIGLPGRSNAFAIAQRLGVPQQILDVAQGYSTSDQLRSEDMLTRIAQLQRQAEAARDAARRAERAAEKNADSLRARLRDIDDERRKILEAAREDAIKEMEALRNEVRVLRGKVLAFGGNMAEFKQLEAAAAEIGRRETEDRGQATRDAGQEKSLKAHDSALGTSSAQHLAPAPEIKRRLRVNDTVRVKTLGVDGIIASIAGDMAEVLMGRMRTKVRLIDLERTKAAEPEPLQDATTKYERGFREESPGLELDMRGMMADEGVQRVNDYLDRAVRAGLPWVRVIHGRGTGALRKATREAIKSNPNTRSFDFGIEGEGGDGVTVVKLRSE